MKHILKTDPDVFQAVADGAKTYEIRFNDRGFAVGDELLLRETTHTGAEIAHGSPLAYSGREITKHIGHVLEGYGLQLGWSILSFAERAIQPAQEPDHEAEMAKVNRDVELMGVGFLVDRRRCGLNRITWFNRPGDTWLPPPPWPAQDQVVAVMAVPDVKEMVNRFLGWKLPRNFSPDNGIWFDRPDNQQFWPIGTNLFTADEATAMFEHCAGGERLKPVTVEVRRNRVWIVRGVQSFMLAYEADTDNELNWYAEKLCSALGGTAPPTPAKTEGIAPSPQPELSGSIDTPEFREKIVMAAWDLIEEGGSVETTFKEVFTLITAWKDAACAVAREEGNTQGWAECESDMKPEYDAMLQRVTAAEAKLDMAAEAYQSMKEKYEKAEEDREVEATFAGTLSDRLKAAEAQLTSIRAGLHDLHAFTFVGFMDDQEFFKAAEVRALIRGISG